MRTPRWYINFAQDNGGPVSTCTHDTSVSQATLGAVVLLGAIQVYIQGYHHSSLHTRLSPIFHKAWLTEGVPLSHGFCPAGNN